mgnify:CR=1 FL=1
MAATWTVSNMDRLASYDSKTDVVTVLHRRCEDVEIVDGVSHLGSVYGSVGLDITKLDGFTDFADITEEKAVEWAKAALGEEAVKTKEDLIAGEITSSKTPKNKTGVPW